MLVTDAPYRSQQAATEADPFAAVYAAQVPFDKPGNYSVMAVTLVDGKPVAAPGRLKVITPAQDQIPEVGEPAPKVQTDTVASAGGDVEAIDTRRPTSDMHADFAKVVGKKPVALLFATPQLCQSRVCGPVVDVALQLRARYGDRMDFIHQEVYTDNDPEQGAAQAAAGVQPADRAVAVRRRQGRQDHRAARGLVRPRRVRAGAQDRAVSRRARLAVAAAGAAARSPPPLAPAGGRGARARPAHEPADPRGLFGWAAAIVLVASFAGLAVLWPRPRLQEPPLAPAAGRRSGACSAAGPSRRSARAIGVALLAVVIVAGYDGRRLGARQPRADVHPDRLLGRARVRQRAVRRRVPRVQPVARDPAAGDPRPTRERWGRYPAALALLGFTWIELVSGWGEAPGDLDDRRGRLHRLHARDAGDLRHRGVDRATARRSPSTSTCSRACRSGRRATASSALRPPLGGLPRLEPVAGHGAVRRRDDRHRHVRRPQPGPAVEGRLGRPRRCDRRDRRARRRAQGRRHARACCSASPLVGGFYRLGIDGARSVGGDIDAAELRRAFIHTLVPIAMVYVAAHYLTFLLFEGQATFYLASDPFGRGWDMFGTAVARDRLHVPEPERDLVPAGRVRRGRPRRRADARPRPRAGALPRPTARGALAVLDARRDGRLHVARAVAARAGDSV